VSELSAEEFAAKAKQEGYVVLDLRTPVEYAEGHWPDAWLLDYDGGEFSQVKKDLDPELNYLLYCRTDRRSTAGARELKKLGIKAYILEIGYSALEPFQD
jgi:rhodanese-related sulfurtransferase